jgi:hypothetical protein
MFEFSRAGSVVHQRARLFVLLLVSLGGALGCSDYGPPKNTEGLENLQAVTGSVSFEGQPTPGAIVLFLPVEEPDRFTYRVAGTVDENGAFEMQTSVPEGTRPGVAPGEYFVTISWNEPIDPRDRDSDDGPDLVPSRYKDHKTSGLRVEIVEGTNELQPFELTP